jgi:hypothetical protein
LFFVGAKRPTKKSGSCDFAGGHRLRKGNGAGEGLLNAELAFLWFFYGMELMQLMRQMRQIEQMEQMGQMEQNATNATEENGSSIPLGKSRERRRFKTGLWLFIATTRTM